MSDFSEIELSTAVRAIREQLVRAALDGAGAPIRFEVGPIQMDFAVELRREAGARGGVKAWVLSAEAEAKASRATTHRVSFTLTPKDAVSGAPIEVGNQEPGGTSRFGAGN
ncbi:MULTISPECIES: trypco2 family protein [Streptacidiphilus]|uniref:Trypco2 family protein n=1 Tax=Streptacidiphilus cavernicola TaxID=3342716 RepID=A0ABV6USQ9_9ACTN|nr:trypco2 family protein [Streptacidiphilus jeojiense]